MTGNDPEVVEFINRDGDLDAFLERLHPLLDYLLPQYLAEGKAHLVVGIGCTGGRHRSVAIAEHLAARYRSSSEYLVEVVHRDVGRPAERVIDHVGFEVTDLARSARFYDAVFFALGGRRMIDIRARRRLRDQRPAGVDRRARPTAGPGIRPHGTGGERQGGGRCGPLRRSRRRGTRRRAPRARGPSTGGATTRAICAIRTGCGSRSSPAAERRATLRIPARSSASDPSTDPAPGRAGRLDLLISGRSGAGRPRGPGRVKRFPAPPASTLIHSTKGN